MKIRADIAELLHTGLSNRAIARQLSVDTKTVAAARTVLRLPKAKPGPRPAATPETLFWQRVQHTSNGHLLWTGSTYDGTPVVRHGSQHYTARRIAFRIRHGRDPEGYVTVACTVDGCVRPDCMDDRITRQRTDRAFEAIFGAAA